MIMPSDHFCSTPMGTYLGFDFGTKFIGIAVGQTITKTARPLITLHAKLGIPQGKQLASIINEWQPQGLVVGLALQPDGCDSATSLLARKFAQMLQHQFALPIYFIEERLTSVEAEQRLKETPNSRYDIDSMAASIILESWLNRSIQEHCVHGFGS